MTRGLHVKSIGDEKKTAVKAAWMKVTDNRILREVNWKGRVINRKGGKEQNGDWRKRR